MLIFLLGAWLVCLPVPSQGSCLQSEERLSLQINLSARGDQPADLDKLKPYVIEHILVLLVAPAAGQATEGEFVQPVWLQANLLWEWDLTATLEDTIQLDSNWCALL